MQDVMNKMIELDGAAGEGGGQILRSALALAMCTGQAFALHDIRGRRPKPGLMRQHLACVNAAQAVSGATVQGAELGSRELVFEPGAVKVGEYRFAVGSAGSCMLVLQTVLPALMLADGPSRLTLQGGTHNPMAPNFHFIERSFAPLLRRMGVGLDVTLRRHGFYPAGGGELTAEVTPAAASALLPFELLQRGPLQEAYAECLAPGLARSVATRELELLGAALGWEGEQLRTPTARQNEGPGNALMATLVHAHVTEVFTSFGERSLAAEQVVKKLVQQVRSYQASRQGDDAAAAGPYLADQLTLPLALAVQASGRAARYTATELTLHAQTNFEVIQRFLPVRCSSERAGLGWRVTVESAPETEPVV